MSRSASISTQISPIPVQVHITISSEKSYLIKYDCEKFVRYSNITWLAEAGSQLSELISRQIINETGALQVNSSYKTWK